MADEEKQVKYVFYGITSAEHSIFSGLGHCETDRFWRKSIGQLNEKYMMNGNYEFDECRNAYIPPRAPVKLDLLSSLH